MSDPRRMLEAAGTDELAVELLRAGRAEEPSSRARRRAMTAAGAASAAAATMAAATTAAAADASLPPVAAKAGVSAAGLVVKWIGIAAVGGLGLWGAWQLAEPPSPSGSLVVALTTPIADLDEVAGVDRTTRSAEAMGPPVREAPESPPVQEDVPTAARSAPVAAAPRHRGELVDEVAAIDRARTAMDEDPEAALAELEAYRREFAGGALAQEAEVLRIESLARSGRADQARQAASAFLTSHPRSPLATRVRTVLAAL